ncbi:hypothetical protein [Acinetobacter sp. YH12035]|uniref:hypothetical protein n=1 Tax=Acinetobacter sp. YH12035 TaxID=2601045 RepID=UPI0015D456AE|nr:hypothetical protein [Acinetobacter sp. YH12035]
MNFERFEDFIKEQKEFFSQNLKSEFNSYDTDWQGGTIGSGWLASRSGKTKFNFSTISRLKGLEDNNINQTYQEFMKAILILSYRKSNSKVSPQKLYAEFLILKRWYSALYNEDKNNLHPYYLSTSILNKSFEILAENSSKTNLPDHAGTFFRLQEMINQYAFTQQKLEFSQKLLYTNRQNRTPKARETKELINQTEINEDELNSEKLISIRTFINIVSLISLCQTNGEKIVLNLLLLLIITGLRSTEVVLLHKDALIKQPLLDHKTKEHISVNGVKQYIYGIQYHGAKGAGYRVHWIEPSSKSLVVKIFDTVMELTKEYRDHIKYIKSKKNINFLPKFIDKIDSPYIELGDMIGTVFRMREQSTYNSGSGQRGGLRASALTSLKNVPIYKKRKNGKKIETFFLKEDINDYIVSLTPNYGSEHPLVHSFNYEGKIESINYENFLFLHEYKSTNLYRKFSHITNIIPFNVNIINNFFGGRNGDTSNISAFVKYNLMENENEHSKLTSHIPRHNINTFLALAGLSDHIQAMLMGRVDIKQNAYYQHLALKQKIVSTSMLKRYELSSEKNDCQLKEFNTPLECVKNDGVMYFSENLDLEHNLKMNLHSYDSKREVSTYIKKSFFNDFFNDIEESFNELVKKDNHQAESLIERHAYLNPLPFGSCMREISIHGCPKRLACQSGHSCGNFTLTGRRGELEALQLTINDLKNKLTYIQLKLTNDLSYKEMLEDLQHKVQYLDGLELQALQRKVGLSPISIFPYIDGLEKLPVTLSELFAIECEKMDSKEA